MKRLAGFLVVTLTTVLASVTHGADWLSKGIILAAGVAITALLGWWASGSYFGLLAAINVPVFWFVYRTSRQARAELDYMGRKTDNLWHLAWQYLPYDAGIVMLVIATAWAAKSWLLLIYIALLPVSLALFLIVAMRYRIDPGETARENRMRVEMVTPGATRAGLVWLCITIMIRAMEHAG